MRQGATLTSGPRSIQSGGQNRSFILRIPDNYDRSHQYRLIFGFHWNGGTANDVDSGGSDRELWSYCGLRHQANNSTIFVAPQGNGNGWANPGGQDVTFVDGGVGRLRWRPVLRRQRRVADQRCGGDHLGLHRGGQPEMEPELGSWRRSRER